MQRIIKRKNGIIKVVCTQIYPHGANSVYFNAIILDHKHISSNYWLIKRKMKNTLCITQPSPTDFWILLSVLTEFIIFALTWLAGILFLPSRSCVLAHRHIALSEKEKNYLNLVILVVKWSQLRFEVCSRLEEE